MDWKLEDGEWRAQGSYTAFRVYADGDRWRAENCTTRRGERWPTAEEAKKACEAEDRRQRM